MLALSSIMTDIHELCRNGNHQLENMFDINVIISSERHMKYNMQNKHDFTILITAVEIKHTDTRIHNTS